MLGTPLPACFGPLHHHQHQHHHLHILSLATLLPAGDLGTHYVVLRPAAWKPLLDDLPALLLRPDLDVYESRLLQILLKGRLLGRPADSAGQGLGRLEPFRDDLLGPDDDVGDRHPSPVPQNAVDLAEHPALVWA